MNTSDSRRGAPRGQSQCTQMPAVIPGGLYTRRQLETNLGTSADTFAKWIKAGLIGVTDSGAANSLYFADDVLAFIAKFKKEV